jgi:hypothetical protein
MDGYWCYKINAEIWHRVYPIKYENNNLIGWYTQFGMKIPVLYYQISEIAEDQKCKEFPSEIYILRTEATRLEILQKYWTYERKSSVSQSKTYDLGRNFCWQNNLSFQAEKRLTMGKTSLNPITTKTT